MTTGSSQQMSSVMDEEFQNKISQNAQLMSLVSIFILHALRNDVQIFLVFSCKSKRRTMQP